MGKVVYFDSVGGPEVLIVGEQKEANPQDHEVLIKHTAIGVNFLDVQIRKGNYSNPNNSKICGSEAVGVIQKVGSKVEGFKVGQRVAYATSYTGAYAQYRCIDQKYLVAVPEYIEDQTAAACLLKGLVAHYLSRRVFIVQPGTAVLVHSAAGGVGHILSALCQSLGALVIGTIGREEKREIAKKTCHYIVNHNSEDWVEQVISYTKNIGVNAVYDSIGKKTFHRSLDCLMPAGIMVLYGQSSGPVSPLNLDILRKKSLFLTCPTLFDYKANKMELILSADEVFRLIQENIITPNVSSTFSLEQASEVHKLLESGTSVGSIVLVP